MKIYTKEEIKAAKEMAYRYVYGINHIVLNRNFNPDRRTRIGNLAILYVKEIMTAFEGRHAIKDKRRRRAESKPSTFQNVLSNPLVKHYLSNRPTQIYSDHLRFGTRNHWAKNEFDRKILSILAK